MLISVKGDFLMGEMELFFVFGRKKQKVVLHLISFLHHAS